MTWVNVARYHLVQRFNYLVLPWVVLAFAFVVDIVILALTPAGHGAHRYVGGLASIFVRPLRPRPAERGPVVAVRAHPRPQPTLLLPRDRAARRRSGRRLRAGAHRAAGIERATGGWGMPWASSGCRTSSNGPWYLTWLTSFVALALLFVYGMWFGLVYRRWNLVGRGGLRRRPGHRAARRSLLATLDPRLARASATSSPRSAPRGSPAAGRLAAAAARWRVCHHAPGDRPYRRRRAFAAPEEVRGRPTRSRWPSQGPPWNGRLPGRRLGWVPDLVHGLGGG